MSTTEDTIFDQFAYWRTALDSACPVHESDFKVFVGCGTSYNLALSLAGLSNLAGQKAIAVPGGEWVNRPGAYCPDWTKAHVIALSRSGETTETVAAARISRKAGAFVTAITVEPDSSIAKAGSQVLVSPTDKREDIVMTVSASLMLLLGMRMLGIAIPPDFIDDAENLLKQTDTVLPGTFVTRRHIVYLGAGPLYGIALEGTLKLMEMSQVFSQGFHPLEYRHGPISLIDGQSAAVVLHGEDEVANETSIVGELRDKGAYVLGFGGAGDVTFTLDCPAALRPLAVLPALQLLGERMAVAHGLDTTKPRHLTKVVTLK